MELKTVRNSDELTSLIAATNSIIIIPPLPSSKGFTAGILIADYNHCDPHSGVAFGKVKINCSETILVEMPRNNIAVFLKKGIPDEFFFIATDRTKGIRSLGAADVTEVIQEIIMAERNSGGFDLHHALARNDMANLEQKRANIIARASGFGRATKIVHGAKNRILSSVACGYRKFTTGDYVSWAYRKSFGWKNTYYQKAECVVQLKR